MTAREHVDSLDMGVSFEDETAALEFLMQHAEQANEAAKPTTKEKS